MTNLIRDLFLNVTLSITMITLWKFFTRKNIDSVFNKKLILGFTAIVAIILCFSFTIDFLGRLEFNFLYIPIGIIGLYGGFVISSIMFVGALPFIFLFTDEGMELAIILLVGQTVINGFLSKYFIKWTTNMKIITGTFITSVISAILVINPVVQNKGDIIFLYFGLGIFLLQLLCVAFYIYLIENFRISLVFKETLLKAQKMEGLYHLAAAFGHEIRQPMTISKGMLQLLAENNWTADKQQEFLLVSLAELNRAEKIIQNYQVFAEPFPSKTEPFDLVNEIQHVINLIEPIAHKSKIHIHSYLSSAWINGDKTKIEQCLTHIFTNSIEAMGTGGHLTIRSKNINGKSVVEISDSGKGMTKTANS